MTTKSKEQRLADWTSLRGFESDDDSRCTTGFNLMFDNGSVRDLMTWLAQNCTR